MRRLALGVSMGLLLLAWGAGSLDLRPRRTGSAGAATLRLLAGPELLAGAAARGIAPPPGVPLGGFGSRRGASFTSVRDAPTVRALVLGDANGRLALLSLDVLLVPPALASAIEERARTLGLSAAVVLATHTHNGPGGLWDNKAAEWMGMGPYHPAYEAQVVAAAAEALEAALAGLVPARMSASETDAPGICRSRVPGRTPDPRLTSLRFASPEADVPLGEVLIYACHPTILGAKDRRLSAEWPGEVARALPGQVLVVQGSAGEATALRGDDREADLRRVSGAVLGARTPAAELAPELAFATVEVLLPPATGDTLAPWGLRRLAGNVLARLAPATARVSALRLGDRVLLFVPGEVVAPLGAAWEASLGARAGLAPRVVSFADGYLGYLETPEALASGGAEAGQAYFGAETIELIEAALGRAAEAVAPGGVAEVHRAH